MKSREFLSALSTADRPTHFLRLLAGAAFIASCFPNAVLAAPAHLRTNALTTPIGVGTQQPSFSWQSDSVVPNWRQSAYEIVVDKSEGQSSSGEKHLWDSGRVSSSESVNIPYSGPPLEPLEPYIWKVRVWDRRGVSSPWAKTSFETGLLRDSDWKAQWITRKNPAADAEIGDFEVAGRAACEDAAVVRVDEALPC